MKRLVGFFSLLWAASASAIDFGQLDTFTTGMDNWTGSSPSLALGGPGGATDQYLRLQSGPGFPPKMAAKNQTQWTGNYLAAGVDVLTIQLANFGTADISLRAAIFGPSLNEFTSTNFQTVAADGVWRSYTFSLRQADLTAVGSGNDYALAMSNVFNFMFRHDPGSPNGSGDMPNFTGIMGMDNVQAVPEPATLGAIVLGLLGWKVRRR